MPAIGRDGATGRNSNITGTASQLAAGGPAANEGITILASSANTGTIYVGYASTITADAADGTDGFPLAAGASIFLPARKVEDVWVIASTGTQKAWFICQ